MEERIPQPDDLDTQESATENDPLIKAAKLLKRALNAYSSDNLEQAKILLAKAEEIQLNTDSSDELFLKTEVIPYLKSWLGYYGENKTPLNKIKESIKSLLTLLEPIITPDDDNIEYCGGDLSDTDVWQGSVPPFNRDFECYMERRIALAPGIEEYLEGEQFSEEVLNPYEIFMYIHSKLVALLGTKPDKEIDGILDRLVEHHEVMSYIYHMEHSGHAIGFREMLRKLNENTGLTFETPYADVASGPGQMTWWLMYEGLIKTGRITLVDMDSGFADYAKKLMEITDKRNPGQHNYDFWQIDAGNLAEESERNQLKFNSVFSCMTLQWTGNPQKIIESIYRSLNPGGLFVMIGEKPPDVTSTTPIGMALERKRSKNEQLYPGYMPGKPFMDIFDLCVEAGFEADGVESRIMGMTQDGEKIKASADLWSRYQKGEIEYSEEVEKSGLILKNYHYAFTIMFRKPR